MAPETLKMSEWVGYGLAVWAERQRPSSHGYALYMATWDQKGKKEYIIRDMTLEELVPGTMITQPTVMLDENAGQSLMDSLFAAGLRPTEGAGSAGAMAATQAHLADLREDHKRMLNVIINTFWRPKIVVPDGIQIK